jgi:hypothetical protein
VEEGREVEAVSGEDEGRKVLGAWLQWPKMKKRAVPQSKTHEV